MKPRQVRTAADARKILTERKIDRVKVGAFDVDGILRGKYISAEKFLSALDSGFGFCDVVLGWDSNDQLYDNVKYTGWHTAYPDAWVRLLPDTCRELPLEYLTEAAVDQYLAVKLPGHRLPKWLTRLIHRRTEGNPLFMVNLLEYLLAERIIVEIAEAIVWLLSDAAGFVTGNALSPDGGVAAI